MTTQEKKVGGVLDNFLRVEKPAVVSVKEKTILFNLRISERLRDDFRKWCFMHDKKMTEVLTGFIFDQLENFIKFDKVQQQDEETVAFNFHITEKLRDDFHRACAEHGTDATSHITQFIRRQVQNA